VQVIGPRRRCMRCWEAFDPADASLDYDGCLDDPSYVKEVDPNGPLIGHANTMPYPMNIASLPFMQHAASWTYSNKLA